MEDSTAGAAADPNAVYALGSSSVESLRLQRQAEELAPDSVALLDRTRLRPGQSAIDLGCGPRGVIDLLVERVSPGGLVVGLDSDPAHTRMLSEFVARRQLTGVEVICGDACETGLKSDRFDVVHARTVLITVPDPADVVAEMVRLARPGGWVVGLEPDIEYALCYPPDPAVARLSQVFRAAFSRNGADPFMGRRVSELYRQAGLLEVCVEAHANLYPAGHSRRMIQADLVRSLRAQILELGVADEHELDELDAATRRHLANPEVLCMSGLYFLTWGRKPSS